MSLVAVHVIVAILFLYFTGNVPISLTFTVAIPMTGAYFNIFTDNKISMVFLKEWAEAPTWFHALMLLALLGTVWIVYFRKELKIKINPNLLA